MSIVHINKEQKEQMKKEGRVYLIDRRNHKSVELGNIVDILLGGEICTDLGYEIVISNKYQVPIGTFAFKDWEKEADKCYGLLKVEDEKE